MDDLNFLQSKNEQALKQFQQWKSAGDTIVFTNGCFDLIHPGHVALLNLCKKLGKRLIVGLNSDSSIQQLKGPERPILALETRYILLNALKPVDLVWIFKEETPENLIKRVNPDVLAKGGDYIKSTIVGADFVEANGGEVVIIPLLEGYSTTSLINKIKQI